MLSVDFFKRKTAYNMRISDWSSDVCSSDLTVRSASTPDSLGAVVDAAREAGVLETRAVGADHDGEPLFASERLVVSPAAGLFTPAADLLEGSRIEDRKSVV